jgi:hydrogenase maturation factor HypF (carbamoyltransferase family)
MEQPNGKPPISRRSKAPIHELIDKYDKNNGITVKAFCKLHQISEATFYNARKRLRSADISKQQPFGFMAIQQPAGKEPAGNLFAEVNGIKLYQAVPADYLKMLAL